MDHDSNESNDEVSTSNSKEILHIFFCRNKNKHNCC